MRIFTPIACLAAALLLALCAPVRAATVLKADETRVNGDVTALEGATLVFTFGEGTAHQVLRIPLTDIVEINLFGDASSASSTTRPATTQPASTGRSTTTTSTTRTATSTTLPSSVKVAAAVGPVAATRAAPATQPLPSAPGAIKSTAASADAPDAEGFISIFNGKDMAHWDGDPAIWTVSDGALHARVAANPAFGSAFIIYTGGELSDFVLRFKYKITIGNSGVQIRSKVVDRQTRKVTGLQADIDVARDVTGTLWDEGGPRGTLAGWGEKVSFSASGEKKVEQAGKHGNELRSAIKNDDWNDYEIAATGNHVVLKVNGVLFSELYDDHADASKSGALAIQINDATEVQFKDIRLKTPQTNAVVTRPPPGGAWTLRLIGDDRITGQVSAWTEQTLKVAAGFIPEKPLDIPLSQVLEAWRGSVAQVAKARAQKIAPGAEDTAFVAKDDQVLSVRGVALGIEGDSLNFRFDGQDRKIAIARLVGVVMGGHEDVKPDATFHQALALASGDSLSGTWTGFGGGDITLRTRWNSDVTVPTNRVSKIQCRNGRLMYVSDLAPARVEQAPYFDRLMAYRTDKSLTGGTLKLSDGQYTKGIAVHSRCVLHYDIAGQYEKFRSKVGFQDPEGKLGDAAVRVLGDGKVLFEKPDARGDQRPFEIDVKVGGVKQLSLEVDFGNNQDVGDRVVWANARLIRAQAPAAQ